MARNSEAQSRNEKVLFLRAPEQFCAYENAWKALESAHGGACFFQSYAWCGHVAGVLQRTEPRNYEPLVAVGFREGQVAAIWPLSRQKKSGIWTLTTIDDPFGQFSGVLSIDDAAGHELIAAALARVRAERLADVLRIDRVLAGSPLEAGLALCGASVRGEVGAPVLDLRPWKNISELKSSRNKKTMKNLRNATNRLAKAGDHEHRISVGDAQVAEIIEATLRRRSAWLDVKGLTAPQFRSPAHHDVLTGGDAWGLAELRAGFELNCAGKPIAHQWGFIHQKRYYAYMSATDPEAVLLSPGRLHLALVIEAALSLGIEAVELMTPASDYKMVWTDTTRTLRDMGMALSALGQVHDLIWQRTVRPLMKACFYALPAALRRRAVINDGIAEAHDG